MKNRSLESTNGIPRKYATPAAAEERTDFGGRVKGEGDENGAFAAMIKNAELLCTKHKIAYFSPLLCKKECVQAG